MSTPHDVLKRAQRAGVAVIVDGDELRLRAKAAPPRELLDELREHKPALLRLLSQGEAAPASSAPLDLDGIASRIKSWLRAMDRLPKACGIDAQTLKAITMDFALGCWAYEALRLGWSDADLFAIDGGLIPEMSRRALHFRSIGEDAIHLINGRGVYEEWPRRDMTDAVLWWRDDRCVGGHDAVH